MRETAGEPARVRDIKQWEHVRPLGGRKSHISTVICVPFVSPTAKPYLLL